MTPRVAVWYQQPTPYFVGRLNAVADHGGVELEAWFNEHRQADRSWDVDPSQWRFPARVLPARPLRLGSTAVSPPVRVPLPELRAFRPDLLVMEYDRPALALGAAAAAGAGARVAFRVLPNYDAWSERRWYRELAKHVLFRTVDGAKVPGPDGAALTARYGLAPHRAVPVTQSVDVPHFAAATRTAHAVRLAGRDRLGLRGCVFLYAGRLWTGKGLDVLLDAYASVVRTGADVSLLVVGDGVDEQRLRQRAAALPHVAFAGFVQPRDLPAAYALADVFVFPTMGDPHGLVVEEALCAGLPVLTTSAAGDIRSRVPEPDVVVVPPGDAAALADRMSWLAADPAARQRLAETGARLAATREHSRYAEDLVRFVRTVLGQPRRSGPVAVAVRAAGRGLARLDGGVAQAPLVERVP